MVQQKGVNVTPQMRVDQFPDDFIVKSNQLFCIWCERFIRHNRKDNIMEHLWSKMHRDMSKGVVHERPAHKIRNRSKSSGGNKIKRRKQTLTSTCNVDFDSTDTDEDGTDLKNLFAESDDDSSSFEGFGSTESVMNNVSEIEEGRRSGRARKKPARLSESTDSSPPKLKEAVQNNVNISKRRSVSTESRTSIPIRSMPIKKQISYNVRNASFEESAPKGSLKMKISRNRNTDKLTDSSCNQPDSNIKVVSSKDPGAELKLKFVLKKEKENVISPKKEVKSVPVNSDATKNKTAQKISVTKKQLPSEKFSKPDLAPEKSKLQNSKQVPMVKNKKEVAKTKKVTLQDKKKKITGYMLWSKHTRGKITQQFPGLEFGDVSKKLGDMWKKTSIKEKKMWHVRGLKAQSMEGMTSTETKPIRKPGGRMIETGPKKVVKPKLDLTSYPYTKHPDLEMEKELKKLPKPSSEVVDVAAHLHLLGESFMDLHSKVFQSDAQVTMRDAQGTLMDGLLSSLVPLIALTKQIPCLKDAIKETDFQESLANIAHIMPGL